MIESSRFCSTEMCMAPSLSGKHGVGRIDIVENRFIGMKSRGKELNIYIYFQLSR